MLKVKELLKKIVIWINNNLVLKEYDYTKFKYNSGFTWSSDTDWTPPKATKCGRIVTLSGAFKNTAQKAPGLYEIGYVPTGCEPLYDQIHVVNPTATVNRLLMRVYPSGRLLVERYGTSTYIAIPANSRLTLNMSYISKN